MSLNRLKMAKRDGNGTKTQRIKQKEKQKEGFQMIQDIAPKIYKNEYQPQLPGSGDHLLFYEGRKILVKKDRPYIKLPVYEEGCAEEPKIFVRD